MKWGTKYGPEYVNRLHAMVQRHTRTPHAFVCLTDDSSGIHPDVVCLPIPPLDLPAGLPERGWTKLTTLGEVWGLRGTALFLDVDVVIVASLDPFFSEPGRFLIIHDWKRPWRITGNSSVYRFELGVHGALLDEFRRNFAQIRQQFRNEQAWLSHVMQRAGLLQYWPAKWCCSFKYHCIPRFPLNLWRAPTVPHEARVVVFHGVMNPPDALAGRSNGNWRRIRPALWIAQHWTDSPH
ncbi:glycosyltransferase [Amphibiibacter pelophylacis]|uniref:Glycosyltransferase n=1 Tax=Amphibiibacter pelophylacis TaxID=1799477 RepID=A0ACC6P2I8_9BURK